jgi:uncharacterized protein YqgC (DUF456 family)
MAFVLASLGWSLLALVILVALFLDLLGLFGNWLLLAAFIVVALITQFAYFGMGTLFVLLLLALLGEGLEFAASGIGTAKFGGSKGAITASLIGCIVGAILGTPILPIIGTLLGACVGAFLAAALYEYIQSEKGVNASVKVGIGAALGKVAGFILKFCIGIVMLIAVAWAAL